MERLQALGIGKPRAERPADTIPDNFRRFEGRQNLETEKLLQLNGQTYIGPRNAPIVERQLQGRPQSASSLDTLTGDPRSEYIPGVQGGPIGYQQQDGMSIPPMFAGGMGGYSQGGMFDPPSAPTRSDFSPQRPDSREPVQQADSGMGMRTQETIPVQPTDILDQELNALMRRIEGYSSQSTPVMPSRQGTMGEMPMPQTYQPQPGPMDGPGMFVPQQPNVPQGNMGSLIPGSFDGQLPMPAATSFNPDAALEAEFPMPSNAFGNLPVGTSINEQGDLVDARTGEVIIPGYQPTVTSY